MSNFSDTPAEGEPFERATFVTRASSVPTTTDSLLDRPPLVAARSAEKLARNALAGIPQAREEVVRIAKVATERIYSHSVREEMLSDSSLVVLEMLAPVLKDLRRSGELPAPQAEFLAARVRESARDWLQASTAAKADAGIGRQPGADEATAHLILGPFQAAGLLRTLAALSPDGRIRPDAELGTALGQAAHVHPFAINPGLLVDVLDANSVQSVDALRISLRAAAQMPQPSAPPAVVVAAAAAGLGQPVNLRDDSGWVQAAQAWSPEEAETFAVAVAAHPALPAAAAEPVLAGLARGEGRRTERRMRSALTATLETLNHRLGRSGDAHEATALFAGVAPAWSDRTRQLATLRSLRTLSATAGRRDEQANQLAADIVELSSSRPEEFTVPLVAAAGVAASMPAPSGPQGRIEPEHPTLAGRIIGRLAGGLSRALDPLGDAGRWAHELGQKCLNTEAGAGRRDAWSALVLAAEYLSDGQPLRTKARVLTRLLRSATTGEDLHPAPDATTMVHRDRLAEGLHQVSQRPLPINVASDLEPVSVAVSLVPGWQLEPRLKGIEQARLQPGWNARQISLWIEEPDVVAVMAEGQVCGWMMMGEGRETLHFHAESTPDHAVDPEVRGAVTAAAAVALGAEQNVGVAGEGMSSSLGLLSRLGGHPALGVFADAGRDEATEDEVRMLAASAGWSAEETLDVDTELSTAMAPGVTRGRGR